MTKSEKEAALLAVRSNAGLGDLPARVVAMCKTRGWSMHWTHRGAYLHLEASELIEAIRGKHGDPSDEAGDVLLVLMSITEYAGIPFGEVIARATAKLTTLETAPHYPGEEWTPPNVQIEGQPASGLSLSNAGLGVNPATKKG